MRSLLAFAAVFYKRCNIPPVLAILGCSQLVTLAGSTESRIGPEMSELSIIRDGAMLIRDGVIERVGTRAEIEPLITTHQVIDAGSRVVLPGFVDAHTHPVFGGNRAKEFEMRSQGMSYQDIAAAGGGIRSSVHATRMASEDELFSLAKKRSEWFLRGGTTTVEAKSGYGLSLEDELKMLRVINRLDQETAITYVPTFLGAHSFPDEMSREAYISLLIEEMLPLAAKQAKFCDIFCEERYFTTDSARQILGKARQLGMKLRMHADQLTNSRGAEFAAEMGAKTADHLEQTEQPGIRALGEAGVMPVLLPGSVYALGLSRYPRARDMIDAGLPVVLATDFNPGSSPTASMPMILNLASTQMQMNPAEAITAATINAAHSLDLEHDRGSLEVGKRADFVVWNCEDYREIAYWIGAPLVHSVYIDDVPAVSS